MQIIRKCNSLPAMRVHAFSTKPVCMLKKPMNLIPALEKAGLTELFPLEFAEWITRRVMAHFLSETE
jgi:hypothetical protein